MKLKEFEGKQLFEKSGIPIPKGSIVKKAEDISNVTDVVVKAQILSGKRGKHGGIRFAKTEKEAKDAAKELLGKKLLNEKIEEVLVEEKINAKAEYYLGFFFDTMLRSPVVIFSKEGGVDIEKLKGTDELIVKEVNVIEGLNPKLAEKICKDAGLAEETAKKVSSIIVKLYECFKKNDMKMAEINPLIEDNEGNLTAADAVVLLDDDAMKRHEFNFPQRTGFREKTKREIEANKIDLEDYKGVAGRTFIDLDGDIATMSSGGGASVVALDTVLTYGGTLANYTEYSGNPPPEKVYKLTKIVLDKKNLAGCFVVGGRANFTRIDITLKAFLDALLEIKPKYPIVVRRAGPGDKEAFEMLKKAAEENDLDMHLFDDKTPISLAAKKMVELAKAYKEKQIEK